VWAGYTTGVDSAQSLRETVADSGDAFADFVRPHWSAMARFARRLCGTEWEDVLQDALTLAWRKRAQFNADRGSPRTWLLTLTADQARKAIRRAARPVALIDQTDQPDQPSGHDLDMERAIERLSERQRIAVELCYFLDLPIADIAVVMSCSPGTVKSTLSDARARLRDHLGGDYA
jgi:RNA polymerase sigma factor (sigma-70 family)